MQPRDAFDIAHLNAADLDTLYSRYEETPTSGLFVGLLQFRMKGEDLEVVVDKSSPLLPPLEYVREVGHVTEEEWRGLRGEGGAAGGLLCKQVAAAACALLARLHETVSDMDSYSIYTDSMLEIGGTSVVLIIPPQVVLPLGSEGEIEGTISVPLQNYEILLNRMAHPELTRAILHVTSHINTCHAIVTQMIRQTLSRDESDQLKTCQVRIHLPFLHFYNL